jgi:hypothetical protein
MSTDENVIRAIGAGECVVPLLHVSFEAYLLRRLSIEVADVFTLGRTKNPKACEGTKNMFVWHISRN